ncbi:hypothetical protein L0657_13755 [Dyadobacter sp. CY345]|nr:hypothetical protein [Dyadobacter sp. CY345]MCF2445027.1 hypothetical protein [Dyadobacter sp. CY345]
MCLKNKKGIQPGFHYTQLKIKTLLVFAEAAETSQAGYGPGSSQPT